MKHLPDNIISKLRGQLERFAAPNKKWLIIAASLVLVFSTAIVYAQETGLSQRISDAESPEEMFIAVTETVGGTLSEKAPSTITTVNSDGKTEKHTYLEAYVVESTYTPGSSYSGTKILINKIETVTIAGAKRIVYTPTQGITGSTTLKNQSYLTLESDERILLVYTHHGAEHTVSYTVSGDVETTNDDFSIANVYGETKPDPVDHLDPVSLDITIPRGYSAEIKYTMGSETGTIGYLGQQATPSGSWGSLTLDAAEAAQHGTFVKTSVTDDITINVVFTKEGDGNNASWTIGTDTRSSSGASDGRLYTFNINYFMNSAHGSCQHYSTGGGVSGSYRTKDDNDSATIWNYSGDGTHTAAITGGYAGDSNVTPNTDEYDNTYGELVYEFSAPTTNKENSVIATWILDSLVINADATITLESSLEDKDSLFKFAGWEVLGTNGESVAYGNKDYTLTTDLFPNGVIDLSQQTEVDKLEGYVSLDSSGNSVINIRAKWEARNNTSDTATVKLNYYIYKKGENLPTTTTIESDTIAVPVGATLVSQLYSVSNNVALYGNFSHALKNKYGTYQVGGAPVINNYTVEADTTHTFANGSTSTASSGSTGLMSIASVTKDDSAESAGNPSYSINVYATYADIVITGLADMDRGYWVLLILTLTALAAVTTAMTYRRRYGGPTNALLRSRVVRSPYFHVICNSLLFFTQSVR